MEYYVRLKGLREDSDKSQKEIAEYLGTEQSYYAKYEKCKKKYIMLFNEIIYLFHKYLQK